jgi:Ca2+-binding EF-hand superfamily protein
MRLALLVSSMLGLTMLATPGAAQAPVQPVPGSGAGMHPGMPRGADNAGSRGHHGRAPGRGDAATFFLSPAGEPFRVTAGGPSPLATWFAGADADHDGVLTFAEFRADFRRFFATLDTNHDGEIAPDEVSRYETEILPEIASGVVARFGLVPIRHPIMAADDDLNRGVSVAEFDHAATSRFNLLDEHHVGRLTLEQLEARRILMLGARFEEPANRPRPPEGEQPQPEGGE